MVRFGRREKQVDRRMAKGRTMSIDKQLEILETSRSSSQLEWKALAKILKLMCDASGIDTAYEEEQ